MEIFATILDMEKRNEGYHSNNKTLHSSTIDRQTEIKAHLITVKGHILVQVRNFLENGEMRGFKIPK